MMYRYKLALRHQLVLPDDWLSPSGEEGCAKPLDITVVYTHFRSTLEAVKKAAYIADGFNARIALLVPEPVSTNFLTYAAPANVLASRERLFAAMVCANSVEVHVAIYRCLSIDSLLKRAVVPRSLILFGEPKYAWWTWEARLVRRLCRRGQIVILAEQALPRRFPQPILWLRRFWCGPS